MIEIDGKKITFTQGDRFDVVFSLCGYVLKPEDRVIFTVEPSARSSARQASMRTRDRFWKATKRYIEIPQC